VTFAELLDVRKAGAFVAVLDVDRPLSRATPRPLLELLADACAVTVFELDQLFFGEVFLEARMRGIGRDLITGEEKPSRTRPRRSLADGNTQQRVP
jgi:hypothetical protein